MQESVLSIAQTVKAGLTAHMKSGMMDKREYFLKEISNAPNIKTLSIIRSDEVTKQFGKGFQNEKKVDQKIKDIFQSKTNYFVLNEWGDKATIHAIIPYIASSKGNLNCLQCHHVPENTVLGAVEIELDVTEYRNLAWDYLLILFGIIAFFTIVIIFNTSYVIEKFVRKPLIELLHLAKAIFYNTEHKGHNVFESEEFTNVASQFAKFGEEMKNLSSRIEQTTNKFQSLTSEMDTTLKDTLFAMGEAEEKRSKETSNHTRRVVEYSKLLGELIGLKQEEIDMLITAAPLHDIGKIGIPDSILFKAGLLDDDERAIIQTHTVMGYDILKHSQREALQTAARIALEHHERWDGTGYPKALSGDEIHIFGRIVAVSDVFDALSTKRVYKDAWSLDKVKEYFKQNSGTLFDPKLVELFIENFSSFENLHSLYYSESATE